MPKANPLLSVPLSEANEALLRGHSRHLRAERKSPRTVQSYQEAGRLLAGFLAGDGIDLEDASRADVQRFMISVLDEHSATTAAVRFRSLQQLYGWAVAEEIVTVSPLAGLKAPKPQTRPVPVVPDDDLRLLLRACAGKDVYDRRDEAIIRLFVDTGVRVSEMTGMRVEDLDMDLDQVTVVGKGDKVRIVPFGARTGTALERFLRLRARHPLAASPWLWVGSRGTHLRPNGITQMLERRCDAAGVGRVHPHQLRHSSAAYAAGAGMGDDDMMRIFGWSSREMLSRYGSAVADERARAAHRRLQPGDRL